MDVELMEFLEEQPNQPRPTRPEGFGITITEYIKAKAERGENVSDTMARKFLDELVKSGIMKKELMICGTGSTPYVYYRTEA